MRPPETGDLALTYEYWRRRYKRGWGLAWYLAAEINERFYASHSIRPEVIAHDGVGYYGIAVEQAACRIIRDTTPLGRFTATGNVENCRTGGPGDHGLDLSKRAADGESPRNMLCDAIRHLGLLSLAPKGHYLCRHKRWGASSQLVFRLAALMALRWNEDVQIWNCADQLARLAGEADPNMAMAEHPGHLIVTCSGRELLFAGDGRVLKPAGCESVWARYMIGESLVSLLRTMESHLGLA